MIRRLLFGAALLAPLSLACVAVDPHALPGTPGASVTPALGLEAVSSTRTPLLTSPAGTGVALDFGPPVYSQQCFDEINATPPPPRATPTPGLSPTPPPTATFTPIPTATPGPAPAATTTPFPREAFVPIPLETDSGFADDLADILGDQADSYAFIIKDLATGRGAQHNVDQVFYAASVFKLFVMYEVFNQQSQGRVAWDGQLVVTPYYDSFGLTPRRTELCQVLSVAEAMNDMLSVSDNTAAVLLQDLVTSGAINSSLETLGIQTSGLFEDGLPVTAADLALLLEAIARGATVSRDASSDMLQLMTREELDNGLEAGIPAGENVIVAHKTGNWDDATHDAGVVFAPFGTYLFVALSNTNHETAVIKALSTAAYNYFKDR
ncbi:MAG TPA: serine hydrolase [Dehalococcoidia bacterium]